MEGKISMGLAWHLTDPQLLNILAACRSSELEGFKHRDIPRFSLQSVEYVEPPYPVPGELSGASGRLLI